MAVGPIITFWIQIFCLLCFAAAALELALQISGASAIRKSAVSGVCLMDSPLAPSISIVSLVSRELEKSRAHVQRLLALEFGNLEIVLVVKGANEEELAKWIEEFGLHASQHTSPSIARVYESSGILRLVTCEEACTYQDSLNAGLAITKSDWVAAVSALTCFSQDALKQLISPVLEDPERVLAVGTLAPDLPFRNLAGALFGSYSERIWLARCAAYSDFSAMIPGRRDFLLFNRGALAQAGGFSRNVPETVRRLYEEAPLGRAKDMIFFPERFAHPYVPDLSRDDSVGNYGGANIAEEREEHSRLIIGRGMSYWLTRSAIGYLSAAPMLKITSLAVGSFGVIFGWVPLTYLGLLLSATVASDGLLSVTSVLVCNLGGEQDSEPAAAS